MAATQNISVRVDADIKAQTVKGKTYQVLAKV